MKSARRIFDGDSWSLEVPRYAAPRKRLEAVAELHNGRKVYTIAGLRFCIVNINRPADGKLVYFTSQEWSYLKEQNLSAEDFATVWHRKYAYYNYTPIPQEVADATRARGKATCEAILEQIRQNQGLPKK